jgi:hypothetical protein
MHMETAKKRGEFLRVISRDCDGCGLQKPCIKRYRKVSEGEKVYCPDGTAHLVDNASLA